MSIFITVIAGILGMLGFCLVLRLRLRRLPVMCLSTAICCALYLIMLNANISDFFASAASALLAAVMAECFAIWFKAPMTVFLIPTLLPLIPGASLYRTMAAVFYGNIEDTFIYAASTCRIVGGLVMGIIAVTAVTHTFRAKRTEHAA